LQFMDKSHHGRYLGVQVGSTDGSAATWIKADAQLALRLRLAMQKTMTVDQRSVIAAAIIVPKLLFVAQHAWPTAAHVLSLDRKICNFVCHAVYTEAVTGTSAWLNAEVGGLPRLDGGLNVPDLRVESSPWRLVRCLSGRSKGRNWTTSLVTFSLRPSRQATPRCFTSHPATIRTKPRVSV
ncbi:Secreted peptide, partial [Phytophthora megakarya]